MQQVITGLYPHSFAESLLVFLRKLANFVVEVINLLLVGDAELRQQFLLQLPLQRLLRTFHRLQTRFETSQAAFLKWNGGKVASNWG